MLSASVSTNISNEDLLNAVNALSAEYRTKNHALLQEIEELKHAIKKQVDLWKTVNGKVNKIKSFVDVDNEGAMEGTSSTERAKEAPSSIPEHSDREGGV